MYNYNNIKGCFRFKLGINVANNVKTNFYCSSFHFENIKSVRFLSDGPLYILSVQISKKHFTISIFFRLFQDYIFRSLC